MYWLALPRCIPEHTFEESWNARSACSNYSQANLYAFTRAHDTSLSTTCTVQCNVHYIDDGRERRWCCTCTHDKGLDLVKAAKGCRIVSVLQQSPLILSCCKLGRAGKSDRFGESRSSSAVSSKVSFVTCTSVLAIAEMLIKLNLRWTVFRLVVAGNGTCNGLL